MNWRARVITGLTMVVVALVGLGVWTLVQRAPAQILTLSNGMQYRFAGVTYGTNHVMQSRLSAVVRKLPGPLEKLARKWLGKSVGRQSAYRSAEPSLVVWFEPVGSKVGVTGSSISVRTLLVNEQGVASGECEYLSFWPGASSPQWVSQAFKVFPRRSRTLECVLFKYHDSSGAADRYEELGRFRFRNPAYGRFPEWTPELLPATKPAGDLHITLHSFVSGVGSSGSISRRDDGTVYRYQPVEPGEERGVAVRFTVDSPRGTNESWTPHGFYLSDATGNHLKATSWSGATRRPAHFNPAFWPDEKAWKLTVRFKRKSGFPESDLLVFRAVPLPELGQTNEVRLTNAVHDIQFVLESIVLRRPMTNRSYYSRDLTTIRLKHDNLPDDFAVDLVSVAFDDPTAKVKSAGSSWSRDYHESEFTLFPTNQTHATVTYAVQKTRKVEFLVPPNWVDSTNALEIEVEKD